MEAFGRESGGPSRAADGGVPVVWIAFKRPDVLRGANANAKTELHPAMPAGPVNRVTTNSFAKGVMLRTKDEVHASPSHCDRLVFRDEQLRRDPSGPGWRQP